MASFGAAFSVFKTSAPAAQASALVSAPTNPCVVKFSASTGSVSQQTAAADASTAWPRMLVAPMAAIGAALAMQQKRQSTTRRSGGKLPSSSLSGCRASSSAVLVQGRLPQQGRQRDATSKTGRRFFGGDEDPYTKCSALKLQVALQYSKTLLDGLNKLAETANTDTDEGLHKLMLDVLLVLKRSQPSWRYGFGERLVYDVEDEGARQTGSALQRWGLEAQTKFGDDYDWSKENKNVPPGTTEYIVLTVLLSCYGPICRDVETLKVKRSDDVIKVLDSLAGVQSDELMELDVQWIPEEHGDSLSANEINAKFPEFYMI